MTYEAMMPKRRTSVFQVLVVRVDIGVVIYEDMTPQFGRSLVQVLVRCHQSDISCRPGILYRCWHISLNVIRPNMLYRC